jgi:ABC-type lipoprotein release transport system permease subunit
VCPVGCQHPDASETSVLVGNGETWCDRGVQTSLALARAQVRHGWRGLVGIVVLVAMIGGLVLGGFAAAQRTSTAVDRMIEQNEVSDVGVNPDRGDASALDFDLVAALPMVAEFSRVHGVATWPAGEITMDNISDNLFTLASDGHVLVDFDRPVLSEGRVPDPDSLDEVYVDRTYAGTAGLHVGDTVSFRVFPPELLDTAFTLFETGEFDQAFAVLNTPGAGQSADLRVAGIGNGVEGIVVDGGYEPPALWIGPALYRDLGYPSAGWGGAVVRLTDPTRLEEFKSAVDAMAPGEKIVYQTLPVSRAKVLRATEPAAAALAIFAAVTALLGTLLVGQAISRRFQLDARDNRTLAALGTTRRDRFVTSMLRLALAVVVGLVFAVGLAALLSLLTPVGPAEHAEPTPGFDFPSSIMLGGGLVLLAVFVGVGAIPAWNNARHREHIGALNGSAAARWLAARGASPDLSTGVRFALEPGRGSTAVPTRATIVGAVTAVMVATATIVFASSLDRVVSDGRFFGSNFDLTIDFDDGPPPDQAVIDDMLATLAADPAVERVGELRITEISVNDVSVTSLAFANSDAGDPVIPTIADGRAPAAADEIALGLTTARQLGVGIGDTVSLVADGFDGDATVVGRVVLPGLGLYSGSDRTSIGVGGLVSPDALGPRTEDTKSFVVVGLDQEGRLAQEEFENRITLALQDQGTVLFRANTRPSDVEGLVRLRSLPVVLASLLVLVVGVTLANAMVIAVRRRRRDIAILQSLGSTGGNVTAVGVWQGVTIGVSALLFGLPLGVAAGRWFWSRLADGFGTLAEPVVPLPGLLALVAVILVLAAISGSVPIRAALRHRPGSVLRRE